MLERVADIIRPVIAARSFNGGFVVTPDMMSLVGCSGEEFAGLLRGLGYRSQLEKITPPAPPAHPSQEPEAVPGDQASAGTVSTVNETAAAAETPEQAAESQEQETAPSPEAEEMKPSEASPAAAAADSSAEAAPLEAEAPAEPSATAEPVEMEIWRPARRKSGGRPKEDQRKPRRDKQKPEHRNEHRGKPSRREGRQEQRPEAPRKPRERERQPDPDSPFAALAVLKERARGN